MRKNFCERSRSGTRMVEFPKRVDAGGHGRTRWRVHGPHRPRFAFTAFTVISDSISARAAWLRGASQQAFMCVRNDLIVERLHRSAVVGRQHRQFWTFATISAQLGSA
jgi:hypothetical protein